MGYSYQVAEPFRVKERKVYPWPCQPMPDRTVELFPTDVLTKHPNGSVTKHTGLMMCNIKVPHADLEPFPKPVSLQVGSMWEA
jgi:hypothetical protein